MSNTTLTARLQGKYGETFKTTLGIPQGDGLSPALFIIYLQAAVNYHRNKQRMSDPNYGKNTQITHNADDTDFISAEYGALFSTSLLLPEDLKHYNLQMNPEKTEWTTINPTTCKSLANKKLGTRLSQQVDVNTRIVQGRKVYGGSNEQNLDQSTTS